jgi:hypothetical protein
VAKYGISLEQAIWHLPLAVLNQLLLWDDIAGGRKPRWSDSGENGANNIDALLAEALTGGV